MAKRKISGSRAIVTGASSGIGRHLALELASQGADVVVVARRRAELDSLASEIHALGRRAEVVAGDITDAAVRKAALERAASAFGGLDIVVNNAGVSAHGRFASAGPERLRRIMELNFFAAAELIREAVPYLRQGRQPIVVNMGSILGHRAVPHNSEYCASKFALRGLSEAIRPELARLGIDVLLVSPGTTDTDFFDHVIETQGEIPWAQGQGVSPAHVAGATVRAIRLGKRKIIPSFRGRLLVWLNHICPRAVDRLMDRYG